MAPVTFTHYVRPIPPDYMVIEPVDGGRSLGLYGFDAEEIQRQGGDPTYDVIKRWRRKSAVVWTGNDPHERRLDIEIDRWATDQSVLEEYHTIRSWQGDPDRGVAPPRLRIRWGMWQQQLWTVNRLVWGQMDTRPGGHPVAFQVTIDLIEAIAAEVELSPAEQADATAAADGTTPTDARVYVVRTGDTLSSIAAAELGDWQRWPEIAALNEIADPNVIQVGQELRLP